MSATPAVTATPARSAMVAAVWTLLNGMLALVLFQHADAGPLADVILLSFPFVVGGLVGNGVLVAAALLMVLLILKGPIVA